MDETSKIKQEDIEFTLDLRHWWGVPIEKVERVNSADVFRLIEGLELGITRYILSDVLKDRDDQEIGVTKKYVVTVSHAYRDLMYPTRIYLLYLTRVK
jgi:hypothetical protein